MVGVIRDDAIAIEKRQLGFREADAMFQAIRLILVTIPFEKRCHAGSVTCIWSYDHTQIW